MEVVF